MLYEVVLRTDITHKASGFTNKKFLNKPIQAVQVGFDKDAKKRLTHHSTMEDGRNVYHGVDSGGHHHFMTTDKVGHVDSSVTAIKKGKAHKIDMAVSRKGAGVHKLYHHLITKHNHILTSDQQSHGGLAIWKKMRHMGGVNVHGYHERSGRGEHVDILRHPEDSHVSPKELQNAKVAARTRGKDRSKAIKDYEAEKKRSSMIVVAHKNKNIRPSKPVKEESKASRVLKVIRESYNGDI